jgi:uncharacterized membrane protein
VNQYDKALFVVFVALYLLTFGLFHFMILRVNRNLPRSRRIPHFLSRGSWSKLANEYRGFYPRSVLYRLTVSGAIALLVIAVAMFVFRFWEYAKHIP